MKSTHILLTAGISLALTFTLSCSSSDDPDPDKGGLSGNPEYEYMKERYKYWDPSKDWNRCQNGVVEEICRLSSGNVWYNPLEKKCEEVDYDMFTGSIYELGELVVCGKYLVGNVPNGWYRCQDGVYQSRCDNEWFNVETHYCGWDSENNTDVVKAKGEGFEKKCGEASYNEETHYCDWNDQTVKALVICGTKKIDPNYGRCNNGVVEEKCGDSWYNEITQVCNYNNNTVTDKLECK